MAIIYLGLGSNLGNRLQNLKEAIEHLEECGIRSERISTVIETDPVGGPPQDKFLNAVLKATTSQSPQNLLETLKSIEKKLGREAAVLNGPRSIDIDILLYDRQKIDSKELCVPHPRMRERSFVMAPLEEIAPTLAKEILEERD